MVILRPVPVDIMQIGEQSAVDFFISRDGRLEPFLEKGEIVSGGHLAILRRDRVDKIYYRASEAQAFEKYLHSFLERILSDPAVPSKVKAATLYESSVSSFKKVFNNPNPEQIEEIKKILKPLFKHIVENTILLHDLLSITEHDFSTYVHSVNVGIMATSLAINFSKSYEYIEMDELERQCYGFFLHDIGKAKVPIEILRKEGALNDEEWNIMKKHPEWGYTILMETGHLTDEAAYISMQHHERPDGTGYPFGLSDIHPCARICTIADIFDALELMKKEISTQFDNCLINTFITMLGPKNSPAYVEH